MDQTALALPKPFGRSTTTTKQTNTKQGSNTMSTQINQQMVDLDPTASAFLNAYIEAKVKIKEWQEKADIARQQVESAMGECEIALVNGREAVRWTTVESHRIDTAKIRELLPADLVSKLETTTISRRFTIVEE